MKTILTLSLFVVLGACSTQRLDRRFNDVTWDSLADESYLRWGESRLTKHADPELVVVDCHKGKTKEALAQYRKDYDKKGQGEYYWLHVGNCYFIDEAWTKAEFFYRMSFEEAKKPMVKSIALNNLGLIHFKFGQWEKGKELLKQSTELAPKFRVPKYNLSQLYLQFGHYDRAITVLSDSAFRGHKDVDVTYSLANAYLYKNDLKTAGEYFAQIPAEHFRREDIAATYSLFLFRTGNKVKAAEIIKNRDRSGVPEITTISQKIERMVASENKVQEK